MAGVGALAALSLSGCDDPGKTIVIQPEPEVTSIPSAPPPPVPPPEVAAPTPSVIVQATVSDDGGDDGVYIETPVETVACRAEARARAQDARYFLNMGDAEKATSEALRESGAFPGKIQHALFDARRNWMKAIEAGAPCGAQAAIIAQRRLLYAVVNDNTCGMGTENLEKIARDYALVDGAVIPLRVRRHALDSLGYFTDAPGTLDGNRTREAVRRFQRDIGRDETGTLSPRETALLICHAAQVAHDIPSQNVLGVMYATGLGVEQNTDLALEWLSTAANRGDAESSLNLAMLYGTGIIRGSYRLCDMVENQLVADDYLREAAEQGSRESRRLHARYSRNDSHRWDKIARDFWNPKTDPNGTAELNLTGPGDRCKARDVAYLPN